MAMSCDGSCKLVRAKKTQCLLENNTGKVLTKSKTLPLVKAM